MSVSSPRANDSPCSLAIQPRHTDSHRNRDTVRRGVRHLVEALQHERVLERRDARLPPQHARAPARGGGPPAPRPPRPATGRRCPAAVRRPRQPRARARRARRARAAARARAPSASRRRAARTRRAQRAPEENFEPTRPLHAISFAESEATSTHRASHKQKGSIKSPLRGSTAREALRASFGHCVPIDPPTEDFRLGAL